ncbi:cation diffusion facilitator family transporter [Cellulomonas sp. Sa3CUA2]|uniref:Cation diffusion facilitator family transporter n=1 Tax=Cellulomonas avistercoris TaxID=2762242 RepID=A0ABR8QAH0_9CELL|nr:cation diffusion facilitator family transporter [Cellulomonas avistercoris]MBD7917416.1 cation diffusion facilitator family transporter [Cellulomonas avistercoris]
MASEAHDVVDPLVDAPEQGAGGESTLTVVLALTANVLIAVAKTVAAVVTGAASMLAEAAHSWADTGNEVLLLVAQRRGSRPADATHPFGYGREVYVWSMFAAIGLFAVGAGVSVTHGIQELVHPEPASDFVVAYVVLGIALVLEGVSFLQAWRQSRAEARRRDRGVLEQVLETSDPTVRAVFAEDAAALVGIVIAAAGILAHEVTGSTVPDAVGSILVGLLLGVVAFVLIQRNLQLIVGEAVDPALQAAALRRLLAMPQVARVTKLRLEIAGARRVFLTGAVDLAGEPDEVEASHQLALVEDQLRAVPGVVGVVLSLAEPEEPSLLPSDVSPARARRGSR